MVERVEGERIILGRQSALMLRLYTRIQFCSTYLHHILNKIKKKCENLTAAIAWDTCPERLDSERLVTLTLDLDSMYMLLTVS